MVFEEGIEEGEVLEALRAVIDPDLGVDVVSLGLVDRVQIEGARVEVYLGATSPTCPMAHSMRAAAEAALGGLPGIEARVHPAEAFHWSPDRVRLPSITERRAPAPIAGLLAASGRGRVALHRLPLLALGLIALVAAVWGGLARLGWELPLPRVAWVAQHGPLMICAFLGTVISVERAVGVGRPWAWPGPILTAAGAGALLTGLAPTLAPWLLLAGSGSLVAVFAGVSLGPAGRRHPSLPAAIMGLGALAWAISVGLWIAGWPLVALVPWWVLFVACTVAGERLELSRFTGARRAAGALLGGVIALGLTGAILAALGSQDLAMRLLGASLLALGAWLARFDVARTSIRSPAPSLTRFTALCLLLGYVWIAVAGATWLYGGETFAGPLRDAALHAFFLGFAFSMILGHAPLIFPAVLNRPTRFWRIAYLPLAVLHGGLIVRVAGDLAGVPVLARVGGALNAVALGLFLLTTAGAMIAGPGRSEARRDDGGDRRQGDKP